MGNCLVLGLSVFNIQSQRSCRSWNDLQSGGIEDQEDQTVNGRFLWNIVKIWCAGAACTIRVTKGMRSGSQVCKFIGWFVSRCDWTLIFKCRWNIVALVLSVFNLQSQRSCSSWNDLHSGGIEGQDDQTVNFWFLYNNLQIWFAGDACNTCVTNEMRRGNQVCNFIGWFANRWDRRLMIQDRGNFFVLVSSVFNIQSQRSCSSWNDLHSGVIEDQEGQTVNGWFLWNSLQIWCAGAACTTRVTKGMKLGSQACKFIGWFANRWGWILMVNDPGNFVVLGSSVFNIQSQRSCISLNDLHSGGIENQEDQAVNWWFLWKSLQIWCAGAACKIRVTNGMRRGNQVCNFIGWFANRCDWILWWFNIVGFVLGGIVSLQYSIPAVLQIIEWIAIRRDWRQLWSDGERVISMKLSSNLMRRCCLYDSSDQGNETWESGLQIHWMDCRPMWLKIDDQGYGDLCCFGIVSLQYSIPAVLQLMEWFAIWRDWRPGGSDGERVVSMKLSSNLMRRGCM